MTKNPHKNRLPVLPNKNAVFVRLNFSAHSNLIQTAFCTLVLFWGSGTVFGRGSGFSLRAFQIRKSVAFLPDLSIQRFQLFSSASSVLVVVFLKGRVPEEISELSVSVTLPLKIHRATFKKVDFPSHLSFCLPFLQRFVFRTCSSRIVPATLGKLY